MRSLRVKIVPSLRYTSYDDDDADDEDDDYADNEYDDDDADNGHHQVREVGRLVVRDSAFLSLPPGALLIHSADQVISVSFLVILIKSSSLPFDQSNNTMIQTKTNIATRLR